MPDIDVKLREEELSAKEIKNELLAGAAAVAPVWSAATSQQKQAALAELATWEIGSHTLSENALYAGVVLCLISCAALWIKVFGRGG